MFFKKKNKIVKILRWLLQLVVIFLILGLITFAIIYLFEIKYTNRVYPGITLGEFDIGGKTPNEINNIINEQINILDQRGISFSYQDKKTQITPTISSLESDLAYEIITFDSLSTINNALKIGRDSIYFYNLKTKLAGLFHKRKIEPAFTINTNEINKILKDSFEEYEIEPQNALLKYDSEKNTFIIQQEKYGNVIDYSLGIERLKRNISNFNFQDINLLSKIEQPTIFKDGTEQLIKTANSIYSSSPITLEYYKNENDKYSSNKWLITKTIFRDWLELQRKNTSGIYKKENIIVGLNNNLVKDYINENIAPEINIEPKSAKFEITDGRVVEFQQNRDGQIVNLEATYNLLQNEIINEKNSTINIAVTPIKSPIQMNEINDLGINELLGTGHSSFAGSPKNRRHNIKTGADTLNGLLLKPGEEMSLIKTLGDIDAENDYLPELVIKGNQTIPEYGGGLCQIGTTLFRTVVESGLPVTQRRNHSYRVSYYEPAGTDATIYDPWPDFKFKNDTENHVLIQTRIEGDDIYFDFWGSPDGRIASHTNPTIYNIAKPGPTKLIETLDLEPGEKKCTEHAHNGADAFFDYEINYPDGEKLEKRFTSHYTPWREVCLIGVEELSENKDKATTTPETL